MHGRSVSTVTAYTAHREWATRPPDERYASVHALAEAARARRSRTDARITETVDLHVQAVAADALAIGDRIGPDRGADTLELRAARRPRRRAARIPPNAARIDRGRRDQLRAATCRPRRASALRGPGRTVDRSTRSPLRGTRGSTTTSWPTACSTSWPSTRPGILPLGYKDGVYGCRTGSVRRLSGRPRHVSVPRGRQPESRRSHRRFARRVVPRVHAPEQRRRRRRPDPGCVPVSRRVRESHASGAFTTWPASGAGTWARRFTTRGPTHCEPSAPRSTQTSTTDRAILLRATSQELGATREEVIDAVVQRLDLSRKHAVDAYALAEQHETNPRSVWGYVQGLTRLSQHTPWQDARFAPRPGRQPTPRHGPLTLVIVAVRAQPARPFFTSHGAGLRPGPCPARDRRRARGCLRSQSPGAQRRCVRCAIAICLHPHSAVADGLSHPPHPPIESRSRGHRRCGLGDVCPQGCGPPARKETRHVACLTRQPRPRTSRPRVRLHVPHAAR